MTITPERLTVLIESWREVLDAAVLTTVERNEIADSIDAIRELQSARAALVDSQRELRLATGARDYANEMLNRSRSTLASRDAEIAGLREALQGCADRIKGGYTDAVSYHRALDAAEAALRGDKP
jgi:hypothetical protein